ncbi:MAG: hypothetical protein F6K28_58930 [Microcoleus sp. SIO2G3]|nr:hypothetical protein [Microcoleus sp. SIO2G3]
MRVSRALGTGSPVGRWFPELTATGVPPMASPRQRRTEELSAIMHTLSAKRTLRVREASPFAQRVRKDSGDTRTLTPIAVAVPTRGLPT